MRGSQNGEIHSGVCIESKDEHLGFFQCQAQSHLFWFFVWVSHGRNPGSFDSIEKSNEISAFEKVSNQLDGVRLLPRRSSLMFLEANLQMALEAVREMARYAKSTLICSSGFNCAPDSVKAPEQPHLDLGLKLPGPREYFSLQNIHCRRLQNSH